MEEDYSLDYYRYLGFIPNPDGTFTRSELSPELKQTTPISHYSADDSPVLAKDITINQSNNLWIRLFLPKEKNTKLPLLIYFHGGGFIHQTANFKHYDNFYSTATLEIPALLVSINYRLAPENRLPAAYEDSIFLLNWIKNSPDEWISNFSDISRTYLMGASAGANIAYNVGLKVAASMAEELKPLNIKGLILNQPFFGGIKRTESELRFADKYLPIMGVDLMWNLALPVGANRDHEYCNPMAGGVKSDRFEKIKDLGWKILITGKKGDPLIDRQIEFFKMIKEMGVETVGKFEEGGFHGDETYDPLKCSLLCQLVKEFLTSSMAA